MGSAHRVFHGALGGFGGTLVLTAFRKVLARFGLVGTSAPMVARGPAGPDCGRASSLWCRDWYGHGPFAPGTGWGSGRSVRGFSSGGLGLGSWMGKLVATRWSSSAAVEAANP